jgi:hypothetical protein
MEFYFYKISSLTYIENGKHDRINIYIIPSHFIFSSIIISINSIKIKNEKFHRTFFNKNIIFVKYKETKP